MNVPNIPTISVHQLKQLMESNPALCLIDVREDHEWQDIRIPGAIHVPKDRVSLKIPSLVDPSQPIYLHCRSGVRSLFAAGCLLEIGYQEVYSVDGGILHWELSGYPVVKANF
ncbi:rhodanese-like domain-containing protein [Legionella impletisoli]|uniref:Sulfurtransferase n=1 Tax=Legionella impletisoli TaxID=343510 RepID=A0A917JXT9_9GAMM|nr:rhodanese-like domain-containing protein [Legionella impletisoli]GGI89306.1 sulfurtransferase [Legionella impletisoli]